MTANDRSVTSGAEGTNLASEAPKCKHCGETMLKMSVPPMSQFTSPWLWVCFNDECGYFKRGVDWMKNNYAVNASYRHKVDPFTGEAGPLPVWSPNALRDHIMENDNEDG